MRSHPTDRAAWYTPEEVARAAGSDAATVRSHLGRDAGRWDFLIPERTAIGLVRALRRHPQGTPPRLTPTGLFEQPAGTVSPRGAPMAASTAAHALLMAGIVLISTVGADSTPPRTNSRGLEPLRLVYLALPGPGGGGGGGGLRHASPPPKAKRQGAARLSSPVAVRKPPALEPPPNEPEPPKAPPPEQPPPVAAPVVEVQGDDQNRAGLPTESAATADSRGSGSGGGTGSGTGTGVGEGSGPGLGPGSGGGTGGGPYRPGSGVEPPVVLHEVRPSYTEQARQRGVSGEVVLEVVVLRDGAVGTVRVLRGLGSGLDERAIEAVRQWRFEPARFRGTPVDVLVEVAVEFRLR